MGPALASAAQRLVNVGKLVLFLADGTTLDIPLDRERMRIGRRPGADLCLPYAAVSGEHAVILVSGASATIEDLGSTNGTLVNGEPIVRRRRWRSSTSAAAARSDDESAIAAAARRRGRPERRPSQVSGPTCTTRTTPTVRLEDAGPTEPVAVRPAREPGAPLSAGLRIRRHHTQSRSFPARPRAPADKARIPDRTQGARRRNRRGEDGYRVPAVEGDAP
jgi:hypothetical protein